jgi:hypothetical protein
MAASAWALYNKAKRYIGNGTIQLGVDNFKMALFRTASNAATVGLSTYASLTSEVSATGRYVTGGFALPPATGQWTTGASAGQMKFTYTTTGLTFTASGASINDIRYAVIYESNSAGKLVCYCALSSTQFTVASPNTLTVLPATSGVFTLT